MTKELKLLGDMIKDKKYDIAQKVHEDRLKGVSVAELEKLGLNRLGKDVIEIRAEFISLFGEVLSGQPDENSSFEKVAKWAEDAGDTFYKLGFPLDAALKDASYYRKYIWKAIQEEAEKHNFSASTIFEVIYLFDPLLDEAFYSFSLKYVQSHQKTLENAKSAFLELSVPVVPLIKGVGILPLIGNMDTERSRLLMEKTLEQAVKLKLTHLIFDVSGVQIVDTMVADQLFKVIDALSLIGVKTIVTGIRPEVAQTMVTLGLKLEGLTVKANLHQAFNEFRLMKNAERS